MADVTHKKTIEYFNTLKNDRSTWDRMFQLLGKYVSLIKQNFEVTHTPGEFLLDDVYDATGMFAATNSASALLGMLWPGTAKQAIEISPPRGLKLDSELKEFYERMTERSIMAMDDPKAGLSLSLAQYMLDQMIFGTSGVGVEKGVDSKLLYKSYGVKEMYIEEGRDGRVDEEYLFYEWRLARVMDEYGEDALSEKLKKKIREGKFNEKVKILVCIKPRREKKAEKGALSMPYESVHMEYETKNVLREKGFEENPISVGRFIKLNYERYGRSPGSMALPDIREANALREGIIVATEKILNMPKGLMHDGMFGGGVIDFSAGSVTVFNNSGGNYSQPPIFDIGSPPQIPWAEQRLEKLENVISRHFNIDRLLDFNSQTEMTFGEAQIRNQIRNASLSSLFSRQITEVFTPLIERSVAVLFRMGEFGVIPGSIEEKELLDAGRTDIEYIPDRLVEMLDKGEDIYSITYKTQAANASRAEEYLGIMDLTNYAASAAAIDPSIANRFNFHKALEHMTNIRGVPFDVLNSDEQVQQATDQQAQQAQAAQELAALEQGSNAAKNLAEADKKARE